MTARQVFNPVGAMVDAINHVEWEDSKDELMELRVPAVIMEGGPRGRGTQACEIQNMLGSFYMRQTGKPIAVDVMTLNKARRAGGTLKTIGDQRVWTKGSVFTHRILQEKEAKPGVSREESAGGRSSHGVLYSIKHSRRR